ncbi:MAG TPA: lytic murein transglycosylase [Solirubrobacterales bacterium]|nr:lytic murein transglycosylase [Solirubrobacterales bacterium]
MRHKLALTIALASFGAVTALGVGMAGANSTPNPNPLAGTEGILPTTPLGTTPSGQPCPSENEESSASPTHKVEPNCPTSQSGKSASESPSPGSTITVPSSEVGGGVHVGATINGNNPKGTSGKGAGVTHNQSIGGGGESGSANGGLSFPSATGGGDQAQPEAPSGGAQFTNGGSPTPANPTATIASFGPAPIGVPNFVIDSFEIPPFLLPIYQACGTQYGIPWEVLAAINKIETAFGTNLNVSSAGAVGWMQFLPSTWETYGVDANGDGRKDPYNPVDAICSAANYLHAAGGSHNIYKAILAYNHADWYAQEVLTYARAYGKLPGNLVGSLTGLTEGAHFPVAADARYADEISTRVTLRRGGPGGGKSLGNAAQTISSSPTRRGINIFSHQGAPVVAVNDGVIKAIGKSRRLGKFIVLEDAYGNRYTYAELGQIVRAGGGVLDSGVKRQPVIDTQNLRPRLFALPQRAQKHAKTGIGNRIDSSRRRLRIGSRVIGGAVIARMGGGEGGVDPHINFSIRPVGAGAPRIDPKPILDGWKLLEATAIYRADGKSPFARDLSVGGVLLLSKEALQQRVLADKNLSIYPCGRQDIATGQIDRRVLAVLEYLVSKGFRLTITSLKCGHSDLTTSGNVSEHSSGDAVDIAKIDGVPVTGHQGPGTLVDALIKTVLRLQGTMHPHQVISLENLPGPTSFALPDHYNHVHIGYQPAYEVEYVSPFLNATTGRIDQGVDFTGTGPILAVGDAEILSTGAPGWPEGGGVLYRLLSGSRAGQVIYVFEGVQATVRAGQHVSAGEQIANFIPGGSIEMGFADASGVPLSHGEYTEGVETVWGRRMADFLTGIGGPSALTPGLGSLSPQKWNRLMKRLGQIRNPSVPTGPSKYSLPAGKGKPKGGHGKSGGSSSGD